mgnify:CR=1 FL=1
MSNLNILKNSEKSSIRFVYGSGKRKSELQKSIELLEEHQAKIKDYTYKIHVSGERNSYSKTDNDATFMRMKAGRKLCLLLANATLKII